MLAIGTWSDAGIIWNRFETAVMREDWVEDVSMGMNLLCHSLAMVKDGVEIMRCAQVFGGVILLLPHPFRKI